MPKILAIDDINDNLISLKAIISDAFPNAVVFTALNGPKGIELAIASNPDVILLDVIMPGMDGFEVCRQLKQNERVRDIPVVFLTAIKGDKESRIKALEVGAEGFLSKPIDETELIAQIRAMVKIKTANEQKRNEKDLLETLVAERTSELEKSQAQLKGIFENLQDSYFRADLSGKFTIVSPSAVKMFGFESIDEIIGQPAELLYFDLQDRNKMLSVLRYTQHIKDFVCQARKKDGSPFWVSMNVQLIYSSDGQILGTEGVVRDITERKNAESALKESETQFREFFEKAADAIFIADIETGMIEDVNEAATRLMNRSYEQLVGIHQSQLHPPVLEKYAKETFNNHKELVKQNLPSNALENSIVRADGIEVPVEILAAEVDYHGKRCMMGTFRDITERKKSEIEIQESEAKYRYMFQHNPQPMWIYDHDTLEILEVNEISTQIYGFTREEFLSMTIKDIRPVEDIPLMLEDVEASRLEENSIGEWRHLKKSGELMNVEISASSIVFNGREARHVLIKDITERKQAEESLRQSEYFFKESQRAAFVGSYKFDLMADFWTSSEVLEQIFGIDKSFTRSLGGWLQIAHPDDREMMAKYFSEEVVSKRNPFNKEYRIIRKSDGETRWVLGLGKLTFNADDNVVEMIGTIQDITDRKRIEASLFETHELNNTLLQTIPFGMDIVDEHGNILFQNDQMSEIFGGNVVGKKCWELYRDDKRQCIDCPLLSGIKIGETELYESGGVLGNRIFQISHTGMMFHGKKAMLEIFQDITGRKESEIALQESEERYRRFISQVSEGVYRFESDEPMDISLPVEEQIDFIYNHLSIAECNDAFLKMYGFTSQKEMLGKTMIDLHDGRKNESNRNVMRNFVENNYHIEETLTEELNAQGQKLYLSNTSIGILENNKLVRIWGTQSDISSRVRDSHVQQVLYSISNAALSSIDLSELIEFISKEIGKLLDSTNFYIAFYDEETNMLSTLYERDEKDVLDSWSAGKSITGYVIRHQKSMRITRDDVQKLCDSGEIEIFGTPSEVWLGVPLVMNKKVIGALVVQSYDDPEAYTEQDKLMLEFISHQISISIERKIAEQELNAALAKAQESDRLKSSFLANMSHEIRTPLNSIIGFSELMSDPDFDLSQQSDFSKMINSSGNNLLAIITDIMDLSKIEAGQVVVRKEPVSVNILICDIHKEYSFMAGKKGIRLEIDLSKIDEQLEIESDESALRKILINFVGNAIKFTKDGFIEIGVKPVGKYLQFHVKDTGIGISAEFHNTIFERFRQIESFSTRKYGGNGLGLAISKSLVELLGGKIWMESESGKGSTFYFSVPIEEINN